MSLLERVRTAAGTALPARMPPEPASGRGVATGFDHVDLPPGGGQGARTRLSKREFDALPLQERIGLLVQGTLRFYRGDQEVSAADAMRAAY
jgi:hypothetical protein